LARRFEGGKGLSVNEGTSVSRAADKIADAIVRQVFAEGLTQGSLIGTEGSLQQRFNVGRGTLREALRELELHGIVKMTRGAGLVVVAPGRETALGAMRTYLLLRAPPAEMLNEVRQLIMSKLAELAAIRIDGESMDDLRNLVSRRQPVISAKDIGKLDRIIAGAARSPVLSIFNDVVTLFAPDWRSQGAKRVTALSRELIDNILKGDGAAARVAAKQMYSRENLATTIRSGAQEGIKKAGEIAYLLAQDVVKEERESGEWLGTEAQFAIRYASSRATMREALGILVSHGVLSRRRGVGGGIIMGEPHPRYTVAMSKTFLRSMKLTTDDLIEAQRALFPYAAEKAALQAPRDTLDTMNSLLNVNKAIDAVDDREFGNALADASQNYILALFLRVIFATFYHKSPAELKPEFLLTSRANNVQLLRAICERDSISAHRLTLRHIDWEEREMRAGSIAY
jgi:DNA-binding FadR family transcriptional regulator